MHSVAISPDASHFGFVLRDANGQPDNRITVFDIVTPNAQPITYELLAPTADGAPVATIVHADAMAFTADGRFLIYDALNAIEAPNGRLNSFSIYSIELPTGRISAVVSPIEGFNIGNPSISKTSDNFITFEAINQQTGVSAILTSNLNTGNIVLVGQSDAIAYPTYTGGDDAIVFADLSVNTTGHSLWHKALGPIARHPLAARARCGWRTAVILTSIVAVFTRDRRSLRRSLAWETFRPACAS